MFDARKTRYPAGEPVFWALLACAVLAASWPCLGYPPISDSWEMFYSFHHLSVFPGRVKLLHLFNLDPFEKMRYQPLALWFYYLLHRVFGADFSWYNALNMVFYLLNLFLLNRLMRRLGTGRLTARAGVLAAAFSFNHFDVVLWSSHIYVLAGTGLAMGSLLGCIRYLERGGGLWACAAGWLLSLWCYEAFALWPLAMLFLAGMERWRGVGSPSPVRVWRRMAGVLAGVYGLYVLGFFWTRWLGTYPDNAPPPLHHFLTLGRLAHASAQTLFTLAFHNLLARLDPLLLFPAVASNHMYMRGPVIAWMNAYPVLVWVIGGAAAALLARAWRRLDGAGDRDGLRVFSSLLLLALSVPFVINFWRLRTDYVYPFTEFRYQYASNLFATALAAWAWDRYVPARWKGVRAAAAALLLASGVLNLVCIRGTVRIYDAQFSRLIQLLSQVRCGLRDGRITPVRRLFWPPDLPCYLPNLCWNIEMGMRFIPEGHYQWLFRPSQQACFAARQDQAAWTVDLETIRVVPAGAAAVKPPLSGRNRMTLARSYPAVPSGHGALLGALLGMGGEYYYDVPKSRQYAEFSFSFLDHGGDVDRTLAQLRRSLEFDPGNVIVRRIVRALENGRELPDLPPGYTLHDSLTPEPELPPESESRADS